VSFNRTIAVSYFVLLSIAGLAIGPTVGQLLKPKPYTQVVPHKIKWSPDGTLHLQYSFVKNQGCQLVRFSVVGIDTLSKYLDYTDNDGLHGDFDRDAGKQSIDITVYTQDFNDIELRTIHQCGDERVSRVFAKVVKA